MKTGNIFVDDVVVENKIFIGSNEPLYDVSSASTSIQHICGGDLIIERTDGFSPQIKFKTNAFASQNGLIAFKDLSDYNQWTVQARSSNHPTEPKEFSISNQYNGGTWYTPFVLMPQVCNRMFVLDTNGITLTQATGVQIKMASDCTLNSGTLAFRDTGDDQQWLFSARASDHATEARQFKITEHHTGSSWFDPFTIKPQTLTDTLVLDSNGLKFGAPVFKFQTPEEITGAGAISLTTSISKITTSAPIALTLADGIEGQEKIILSSSVSANATLTPTNLAGNATVTFGATGDSCTLIFVGGTWHVLSNVGCTLA